MAKASTPETNLLRKILDSLGSPVTEIKTDKNGKQRTYKTGVYLAKDGAMWWRNNTGAAVGIGGCMIRFGAPGSPDILGVYNGRSVGIEVKPPRKYQSKGQKQFQQWFEAAGGLYILARSVEAVQAALTQVNT